MTYGMLTVRLANSNDPDVVPFVTATVASRPLPTWSSQRPVFRQHRRGRSSFTARHAIQRKR